MRSPISGTPVWSSVSSYRHCLRAALVEIPVPGGLDVPWFPGFPSCTTYLLKFNFPLLTVLATHTFTLLHWELCDIPHYCGSSTVMGTLWWLLCSLHRMVGAIHCMLKWPSWRGNGHYYNTIIMLATTSERTYFVPGAFLCIKNHYLT